MYPTAETCYFAFSCKKGRESIFVETDTTRRKDMIELIFFNDKSIEKLNSERLLAWAHSLYKLYCRDWIQTKRLQAIKQISLSEKHVVLSKNFFFKIWTIKFCLWALAAYSNDCKWKMLICPMSVIY